MALQLDNFITPENQFEGLYKMGDTLQKNRAREEQQAQYDQARKATMTKILMDYSDPKDYLSGSPLDSKVTKGFMDLQAEGMKLINENKGLTSDMLMTALAPKVNKLAQYSIAAKTVNASIKERLTQLGAMTGYDKLKLQEEAKKTAFLDENGELKDLSAMDGSFDPISEVIKTKPHLVTNNTGIDRFVKNEPKNVNSNELIRYNSRGGKQRTKVKTTAPAWAIPDVDDKGVATGDFVPIYDKAIDKGEEVIHDFNGKKAAVRLLDENVFKRLMADNDTADWVRGQVMQHIDEYKNATGESIDINSPQAMNVARALLYDELKSRNPGSMEEIVESKPTQIKVYAPRQQSEASQKNQEVINDLHSTLTDKDNGSSPIDVTSYLTGVVLKNRKGRTYGTDKGGALPEIAYNPKEQTFTLTTKAGAETVPYHEFVTRARTNNPNTDMSFLKGFKTYTPKKVATTPANKKDNKPKPKGW